MSDHDIWNWSMEDQPPPDDQPSLAFETVADLRRALAACALQPEPDRSNGMILLLDANLDLRSIMPKGAVEAWAHVLRSSAPREVVTKANTAPRLSLSDTVKLARAIVKEHRQLPKIDAELIPLLVSRGATNRVARKAATQVREEHNVKPGRRPTA
jgi:hypothetical protein